MPKLPQNLQWLLEGIKQREKVDPSWDVKLQCDRVNPFRDITIRAQVADWRCPGDGDEEGKREKKGRKWKADYN